MKTLRIGDRECPLMFRMASVEYLLKHTGINALAGVNIREVVMDPKLFTAMVGSLVAPDFVLRHEEPPSPEYIGALLTLKMAQELGEGLGVIVAESMGESEKDESAEVAPEPPLEARD